MLTKTDAKALGREDYAEGTSLAQMDSIAESFIENFGGQHGADLATAYRQGAGIR